MFTTPPLYPTGKVTLRQQKDLKAFLSQKNDKGKAFRTPEVNAYLTHHATSLGAHLHHRGLFMPTNPVKRIAAASSFSERVAAYEAQYGPLSEELRGRWQYSNFVLLTWIHSEPFKACVKTVYKRNSTLFNNVPYDDALYLINAHAWAFAISYDPSKGQKWISNYVIPSVMLKSRSMLRRSEIISLGLEEFSNTISEIMTDQTKRTCYRDTIRAARMSRRLIA